MNGLKSANPRWALLVLAPLVGGAPSVEAADRKGSANIERGLRGRRDIVFSCGFESERWWAEWGGGRPRNTDTVMADPARGFRPLQGKALRVKVEKGGHYGTSLEFAFRKLVGREPEEIYFRYYLRFADDWDPARGGKLPGISGTYGRAGWGGRPVNGRDGWSARGQFKGRKGGRTPIGYYCYHMDMKGQYGSAWIWEKDRLGYLENNRWYCVEQHVKMNTPGRADGVLRGWIDGKLAFEKTDVRMRAVAGLKIEKVWVNVYHGGKWTAQSDDHLYIDNVVIARGYVGPMNSRGASPYFAPFDADAIQGEKPALLKGAMRYLDSGDLGRALAAAEREAGSRDPGRADEGKRIAAALEAYADGARGKLSRIRATDPEGAAEGLGALAGQFGGSRLGRELKKEAASWRKDPATAKARRERQCFEMLSKIRAIGNERQRRSALVMFVRRYGDTAAAEEGKRLLEETGVKPGR